MAPPGAGTQIALPGAVQRFSSALNARSQLHLCLTDCVFSLDPRGALHFHPAATSMPQRTPVGRCTPCAAASGTGKLDSCFVVGKFYGALSGPVALPPKSLILFARRTLALILLLF